MHKADDIHFPWRNGNAIKFLVDGEQFFPAMLAAIEQAKKFVLMEMYLFETGKVADQFIKAFVKAAKRGVTVQLLIDAYGGLKLLPFDRNKLTKAGVQLVFHNPLSFLKLKQNLFRTHRKYLIIDDKKVFVGGVGITDTFMGKNAWRETVVEVQGHVVKDWHRLFDISVRLWEESIAVPEVIPPEKAPDDLLGRVAHTSTNTEHREIKRVLLNRIRRSNNTVWLATAYFIPTRKTRKALRKAAIQGKDVRLLLPGPITDHPAVRYASRRYYSRLLRHGVKIYEFHGRFTHTKMLLVDDWFTIGSSNMDRWNFRWNLEANQEIEDSDAAQKASVVLANDFQNSHQITYAVWRNRSSIQRFKEWLWGKVDLWLARRSE